jgi:gamma-glutamyltranspeptidase / glutathione hydrolase
MNACLGFLEPTANGIGGDIYAMIWDPKQKKVVGLAGSGASPRGLSLETVRSRAKNGALPPLGAITVSVPGTVDGWWTMHQRYGKLPWATLFEPAIAMAEAGTPVPDIIAYYIRRSMANFAKPGNGVEETANALKTWGMADGKGPQAGQVFRNPDLARTYRAIAQGGRDAFYAGDIARTSGSAAGCAMRIWRRIVRNGSSRTALTIAAPPFTRSAPTRRVSRRCRCSTSWSIST